MRALIALFLSLVLIVTSVTMAVARGQERLGSAFELCSEGGTKVVTLDAQGNPVETHSHLCPDCLHGAIAADLPEAAFAPARPVTRCAVLGMAGGCGLASAAPQATHARDPPLPFV